MPTSSQESMLVPTTAVCGFESWNLIQASPGFLDLFPEAAEGKSILPLLEKSGLVVPGQMAALPDTGCIACPPSGESISFLRWTTMRVDGASPLRLLDVLRLPVGLLDEREIFYNSLLNIIDYIHDGIWMIDANGITIAVNKAMQRIADITREEVVGLPITDAAHRKNFTVLNCLRARSEKRTVTVFDDYANGRHCLNTATPVFDNKGNVVRVIAIIRDLYEIATLSESLEHPRMPMSSTDNNEEKMIQMGILGSSPASQRLRASLLMAASTDVPVLLLGDTGTGKTLAAKVIHKFSGRKDKKFISLNCGSLPMSLLESELFGYESGAFTGALKKGRKSVFELADNGTLFLDEIAELPLPAQATLLHVLDGEPFRRVGGVTDITANVRILAATNKNLEKMVEEGAFRKDLFFRLRVIAIDIPPVRQRPDDIQGLMEYFLNSMAQGGAVPYLSGGLYDALMTYSWPGNIREIRSTARYLIALGKKRLTAEDLPPYIISALPASSKGRSRRNGQGLKEEVEQLERMLIERALKETGSTYKAARVLGVSQSTVVRKAHHYGLGEHIPQAEAAGIL